ncbi:MAG: hypothetical protein K5860_03880 [Bacteroidales bacterium]|nr:hypothetical protein [Bacteroidales bacterium]
MEPKCNIKKDLTGMDKQLKKRIATSLGENDFEAISCSETRFVANQIWDACVKTSVAPIDFYDVRNFLIGNQNTCDKAVFASVGHGETLGMAMQDIYTKPFINELSFTNTPDLLYRIMVIVTLKNEDLEPTGAELTHAIAKVTNAGTDFLWQILVDSQMQENVRVSLIVKKNRFTASFPTKLSVQPNPVLSSKHVQ